MLQRPSDNVAECYKHAADARERAEMTSNKANKADFLDIEKRWLRLAKSYEFAERLNLLVEEQDRHQTDENCFSNTPQQGGP